jgi:hypothetical protein
MATPIRFGVGILRGKVVENQSDVGIPVIAILPISIGMALTSMGHSNRKSIHADFQATSGN